MPKLVVTRPESEIAADLKRRMAEALQPVYELMREANQAGLVIQFDTIAPAPPTMQYIAHGLRVVKIY